MFFFFKKIFKCQKHLKKRAKIKKLTELLSKLFFSNNGILFCYLDYLHFSCPLPIFYHQVSSSSTIVKTWIFSTDLVWLDEKNHHFKQPLMKQNGNSFFLSIASITHYTCFVHHFISNKQKIFSLLIKQVSLFIFPRKYFFSLFSLLLWNSIKQQKKIFNKINSNVFYVSSQTNKQTIHPSIHPSIHHIRNHSCPNIIIIISRFGLVFFYWIKKNERKIFIFLYFKQNIYLLNVLDDDDNYVIDQYFFHHRRCWPVLFFHFFLCCCFILFFRCCCFTSIERDKKKLSSEAVSSSLFVVVVVVRIFCCCSPFFSAVCLILFLSFFDKICDWKINKKFFFFFSPSDKIMLTIMIWIWWK